MILGLGGIEGGADTAPRQTSVSAAEREVSPVADLTTSMVRHAPNDATVETATLSSPPSLASLLDQARAAQAELASQPLPITNHHHRFLMNLFGG